MRNRPVFAALLLPLGAWLASCDGITTGQTPDDSGPPVLRKILIQDETPRDGRNIATDLLDQRAPVVCSDTEPCPANNFYEDPAYNGPTCIIAPGRIHGVCPDPYLPANTPPAIGTITGDTGSRGGNQIRLVFQKTLAPFAEDAITDPMTGETTFRLHDASVLSLVDGAGKAVPSLIYWDPIGSPTVTSDPFVIPYGPALVIKPDAPLAPLGKYTIKLDPTKLVDQAGQALVSDVNGPVHTSYDFTMEALYPTAINFAKALGRSDALVLSLNADLGDGFTVKVKGASGPVSVEAFLAIGDAANCAGTVNRRSLVVVPVSSPGTAVDWALGDYELTVSANAADNAAASLSQDAFGTAAYMDVPFSIAGDPTRAADDPNHQDRYTLPEACMSAGADMASSRADGGTSGDGGFTPIDMASTDFAKAPPADLSMTPADMAPLLDGPMTDLP